MVKPKEDRKRVILEGVKPEEIDGGRYPIKRTVGEKVEVKAVSRSAMPHTSSSTARTKETRNK